MVSVGIFTAFKLSANVAESNVLPFPRKATVAVASPYADSSNALEQLVASDLLPAGVDLPKVSRSTAMQVPAVAKARALLHSVIATRPLRAYRFDQATGAQVPLEDQPTWLYRTDTGISPRMRTRLILDDLIFEEASLLLLNRGEGDAILDAVHIPYSRWTVTETGHIKIGSTVMSAEQVAWIPGPGPGLLAQARDTIDAAISTEKAWAARVRNPFPAMVLEHTDPEGELEPDEAAAFVEAVATARRNPDSAVMYAGPRMRIVSHAADSTDLFESGRNALRLDFANFLNMPAAVLDGSVAEASLTYSTQEGRRNDFLDLTVPTYAGPIEDALSLDGIVPRGQFVRFDFTDLATSTAAPTGPTVED
jgi:hypothetical protein